MAWRDRIITALGGVPRSALAQPDLQAHVRNEVQTYVRSAYGDAWIRGMEDAFNARSGAGVRSVRASFSAHSLVFACMSMISENVAAVPYKLYRRQADGTLGDPIEQHPLLDLLENPFPDLYGEGGGELFRQMMVLYMLGAGNAWILEDEQRQSRTRLPASLAVLGSIHVQPRIDPVTWKLLAWYLTWGSQPRTVPPEALLQLKLANPDHGPQILGLGPLQAAQQAVDADFARQRYDEQFFVHGAAPSMKLRYDPGNPRESSLPPSLTPDQLKQVRETMMDALSGQANMHKLAALNAGWNLETFGVSQRDMEFVAGRLQTVREVGYVFRVPSVLLNDREHGGLSDAEIKAAEALLARQTTVPWCRRLTGFYQSAFVDRYAPGFVGQFDTDEIPALNTDFNVKVDNFIKLVSQGHVSQRAANELVDLGLDPKTLLDEPLVPITLVPLSQTMLPEPAAPPAPAVPPPAPPAAELPPPTPAGEPTPPGSRMLLAEQVRALVPRQDPAAVEHARAARWRAWVQTFSGLERRYLRVVRRYLFDLRAETLRNLEAVVTGRAVRAVSDDILRILFDERLAAETLRRKSRPFFSEAIQIGAAGAAQELGTDALGIDAPGMREFLRLKEIKVTQINDTIRKELRATLTEGLDAGENLTDLSGRVREVFDASATRARLIARTEIATTVNGARFTEMAAEGVERIEWISARDPAVRESHQAVDGEVVAIGEPFSNGLYYPGDPSSDDPEEVCNCRCTTAPVIDENAVEEF